MSIEAMKLALDALDRNWDGCVNSPEGEAITALNAAIEAAEEQEAWKTSDTAYRPDGLPQDFIKHEVDSASDWSEWVCPDPTQYFMKCCDCGLVHEMQFNVVKYSAGDKCADVDDPYVQAVFRARRHEVGEKQKDSLAQTNWDNIPQAFNDWWNADYDDSTNPFRLNSPAYWAWSGWKAAGKQPDAYGYAKRLAVAIWDQHYKDVAPQWKPFDDLLGVLTQIDNMTAGLTAQNQRQPLTDEAIWRQYQALWPFHPAEEPRLAADLVKFARAIEAAHGIGEKT